jgi:hypothetical protein
MKMTIKCTAFRPFHRNTLFGFAEIVISELGLKLKDVALHEKANSRWAALPAKPQIKDGSLVKNADGKLEYFAIADFTSRDIRDAFSAAVVRAVLEHTPGAFDADADIERKPAGGGGHFHSDPIPFAPEWR